MIMPGGWVSKMNCYGFGFEKFGELISQVGLKNDPMLSCKPNEQY